MVNNSNEYDLMCCPELWNGSAVNDSLLTNSTGLSFKPGGEFLPGDGFSGMGWGGYYWSATRNFENDVFHYYLFGGVFSFVHSTSMTTNGDLVIYRQSCRCIKLE